MKQVKTLQSVGQYKSGVTVDVLADAEVEKLVKDGKAINGISQSRAEELIKAGALEEVKVDTAKAETNDEAKPTAKAKIDAKTDAKADGKVEKETT